MLPLVGDFFSQLPLFSLIQFSEALEFVWLLSDQSSPLHDLQVRIEAVSEAEVGSASIELLLGQSAEGVCQSGIDIVIELDLHGRGQEQNGLSMMRSRRLS